MAAQRSQRPLALDIPKNDRLILRPRSYDRSISAECNRSNVLCVAGERPFDQSMGAKIVKNQVVILPNRQQRIIRAESERSSFDRLPDHLVAGHIPHHHLTRMSPIGVRVRGKQCPARRKRNMNKMFLRVRERFAHRLVRTGIPNYNRFIS